MKLIKATELGQGDVILLPFNKTATVQDVPKIGRLFVSYRTEYGPSRVELGYELMVADNVRRPDGTVGRGGN